MKTAEELMHLVHSGDAQTAAIPPVILLVDDDEDALEIYDRCLSAAGYWVARAASGLEALEYAQDLRPDAIVTDIGLGGDMDGADLVRELRADPAFRSTPVLVVTGRGPRDLPPLAGLDMSGLLLKPVEPETLVSRVSRVLRTGASPGSRAPASSHPGIAPAAQAGDVTVRRTPPARVDKKRRACPQCGTRLSWVETRRWEGRVYDYYRECAHGCGLFLFDRAHQDWEMLVGGAGS